MNSSSQIICTKDGSHSIYLPEFDEHYHSVHGAIQESRHVFIEAGFKRILSDFSEVKILEVGLGTGLNCFLTFIENIDINKAIEYTAIEAFPIKNEILSQLNYSDKLEEGKYKEIFLKIHSSLDVIQLSELFELNKVINKIQNIALKQQYNLIYFDAFAPRVQPEMWSCDVFEKLYRSLVKNGLLVTYCAKGEVKRTLKSVGFMVETLNGPPGKREMIRAIKK